MICHQNLVVIWIREFFWRVHISQKHNIIRGVFMTQHAYKMASMLVSLLHALYSEMETNMPILETVTREWNPSIHCKSCWSKIVNICPTLGQISTVWTVCSIWPNVFAVYKTRWYYTHDKFDEPVHMRPKIVCINLYTYCSNLRYIQMHL